MIFDFCFHKVAQNCLGIVKHYCHHKTTCSNSNAFRLIFMSMHSSINKPCFLGIQLFCLPSSFAFEILSIIIEKTSFIHVFYEPVILGQCLNIGNLGADRLVRRSLIRAKKPYLFHFFSFIYLTRRLKQKVYMILNVSFYMILNVSFCCFL